MIYKQTVAPTLKAVTLDELKAHCGVEGYDDYDGLLAILYERAAETVGKRCGRQIMSATFTLTLDYFPDEIVIDKIPVTAVTSPIAYTNAEGVASTLTSTYYQTDLSTLDAPARIKPAANQVWPSTYEDKYGAVVITFQAGYTTAASVPATIKHEICMLVAEWFKNREGTNSESIHVLPAGLDMLSSLNDTGYYT